MKREHGWWFGKWSALRKRRIKGLLYMDGGDKVRVKRKGMKTD